MPKFLVILFAIFETIFYTFVMVLINGIVITNVFLQLVVHFLSLTIISFLFYFFIHFLLNKLNWKAKKYIYQICIWNLIVGLIFPVVLIILIPNDKFTIFAEILLVSTLYYGLFVNICIALWNYFFTNRKKKLG